MFIYFSFSKVLLISLQVVTCVAMSADGSYLAAGFKDCTVKLYERKLPALVKVRLTERLKLFY